MHDADIVTRVREALTSMLPLGVSSAVHEVEEQSQFCAEEMAHLGRATESRRHEFATGRRCLRESIIAQGGAAVALLPDVDGVPILPETFVGSVSHSKGLCVAVASQAYSYACLGIDLEKTNRLKPAAMARVVHADERAWVDGDQVHGSVLFSAKEAFYKAQYPQWRSFGGFHDLSLQIDEVAQTATVRQMGTVFPKALRDQSSRLQIRYRLIAEYTITVCWLES